MTCKCKRGAHMHELGEGQTSYPSTKCIIRWCPNCGRTHRAPRGKDHTIMGRWDTPGFATDMERLLQEDTPEPKPRRVYTGLISCQDCKTKIGPKETTFIITPLWIKGTWRCPRCNSNLDKVVDEILVQKVNA